MYQPIDPIKTGQKLKRLLAQDGYDVKYIQRYLNLSCPQSIYRWFKGKVLPSVEHLSALSLLLGVHMEELLELQSQPVQWVYELAMDNTDMRIIRIYKCCKRVLMAA